MQLPADEPLFPWLTRFCAYRERCISEVRLKLRTKGFTGESANEFILRLQEQDYLSEERYARMFAGGHFRRKQWGRKKIESALRTKGIPQPLIMRALGELPAAEYQQILLLLAEKTWRQQSGYTDSVRWARVRATLLRKGYESALISGIQRQIMPAQKKR
ncbi:MAG: regulatory protein RecX [Sediminibacterium sp.]